MHLQRSYFYNSSLSRKGITEGSLKTIRFLLLILAIVLSRVHIHFALSLCLAKHKNQIYSFQHFHFQCSFNFRLWPMSIRVDAGEGWHSYSQSVNSCLTFTCTPGHVKEDVGRGGGEGWRLNDLQSPPCCPWKIKKKHRRVDVGKLWQTMHKASLGRGGGCITHMP